MHFAREIHEIYFCFVDFDSALFRFGAALQHPRKRFRRVNIRLFEVTSRVPRERTVHTLFFSDASARLIRALILLTQLAAADYGIGQ